MRPITLSLTTLFAIASVAVAQTPSAPPKAPTTSGPATTTKTTATASSPATTTATTASSPAATTTTSTSAMPSADEMKQMMELAKLNDNHKVLASTAGNYSYVVKFWMDPKGNPTESKGTATRKAIMDGRYVTGEHSGTFQMPGADGKMKDMNFKGISLDAYDNAKQKFVSSWIDNMGTGIMILDGTYDAGTKTFTYTGEFEMMPGMKSKIREVTKLTDKGMAMEYYEDRGQGEAKTMEINYTRKK